MKTLIIATILSLINPTYRTEIGYVENNETIVTDGGQMWGYDTHGIEGKFVVVTFNDLKTESIEDDVIVNDEREIKCAGRSRIP